jgi:CrcB protein
MRVSYFLLGAFVGAPVRFVIVEYLKSYLIFPLGILLVNVIGSFLLGLILESEANIAFALMGFSGALTTWSSFIIDLNEDLCRRNRGRMLINLGCNYFMSILAALFGMEIAYKEF